VVNDLDVAGAQATAEAAGAHALGGDAASEAGAQELFDAALARLGDIDIWFGNAGVDHGHGLEASESDWAVCHEVNVMAHVRAARLLVPYWLERGAGHYVITASAAGLLTMLGSPTYSVSKHGAVAFAEWLSATYRHRGIVVQALCPQGVQTRMLEAAGPLKDLLQSDGALTPEQVAEAVCEALGSERFLILPHPEVARYYANRAGSTDRWLAGMNKLQQRLES
jgi:NAD(P)-dependent dehydrogenase (short-subunit alcohol dehydrogenase family)